MAARLTAQEVAERAGHPVALVERLAGLGILTPDAEGRFDPTDHVARGFASGDLTYSGMGAYSPSASRTQGRSASWRSATALRA